MRAGWTWCVSNITIVESYAVFPMVFVCKISTLLMIWHIYLGFTIALSHLSIESLAPLSICAAARLLETPAPRSRRPKTLPIHKRFDPPPDTRVIPAHLKQWQIVFCIPAGWKTLTLTHQWAVAAKCLDTYIVGAIALCCPFDCTIWQKALPSTVAPLLCAIQTSDRVASNQTQ